MNTAGLENKTVLSFYMASGASLTEGYFVKQSADDQITQVTAAADKAIGVLLGDTARTDIKVPVCVDGVCYAIAGGTCTRGYHGIMTTAGAVTNATYANAEVIVCQFLESTTSGNWVKIRVCIQAMPAS